MRLSQLRIGAKAGNDLVLIDTGIADEHVVFEFQRSLFGTVASIDILAEGVQINGAARAPGETLRC